MLSAFAKIHGAIINDSSIEDTLKEESVLKKFLVLFLVAMLVVPATALAVGKPDFAASKSKSKAFSKNHPKGDTETATESGDTETVSNKGGSRAGNSGNAKGKLTKAQKEAKKAEKKALKAKMKADKKLNTDTAGDSTTTVHRGKGIANAMKKIQRNIKRAGEKAPMALKTVVNKFAAWLGMGPKYDDAGNLIEDTETGN